jgi:DNA/RNA endonuclease YhcR with UshA esterase domain
MKTLRILTAAALLALPLGFTGFSIAAEEAPATQPAQETPVIKPEDARKYMDKQVIVEGTVTNARRIEKVCFLNFSSDKAGFYAPIFEPALSSSQEAPEFKYKGKKIQIKGTISEHKGRPQIVIKDLAQITIVEDKKAEDKK